MIHQGKFGKITVGGKTVEINEWNFARAKFPRADVSPRSKRMYRGLSQMAGLHHDGIHFLTRGYSFCQMFLEVVGNVK